VQRRLSAHPCLDCRNRPWSLNFSNAGDFVSIPDSASLELTNQFTFAFWAWVPPKSSNTAEKSRPRQIRSRLVEHHFRGSGF
jgi:hypothetical protein